MSYFSFSVAAIFLIFIWAEVYALKKYTIKEKKLFTRLFEALPLAMGLTMYGSAIILMLNGVRILNEVYGIYTSTTTNAGLDSKQIEIGAKTTLGTILLGLSGILISFGLGLVFFLDQKFSQQKVDDLITKRVDNKLQGLGKIQMLNAIRTGAEKATRDSLNDQKD